MRRPPAARWTSVLAALLLATVVGCDAADRATKAGGSAPVLTLRLGTNDAPASPVGPVLEDFADRVRQLSDGTLRIEPVWTANGADLPAWDQRIARKVVAGELDLALVPTRAWDTEGVDSLRALSAPLLLTSQPLIRDVVSGDLVSDLMSGLPAVGVTGLALLPEGLRHVFSFGPPVVSPAGLAGARLRTPRSDTGYAVFRAWGAVPQDLVGADFEDAVADGRVAAADSSFARAATLPSPATTVAANVTPSATVHALVVRTSVLDGLTERQAEILGRAATAVRDELLASPPDEAALARAFCAAGGRVVNASPSDLLALETAAQPVHDVLAREPATQGLLASIRQRKAALPPPPDVPACAPAPAAAPRRLPPGAPADTRGLFPEGVYRMSVTVDGLIAQGARPEDAETTGGAWTLTFAGGKVTIDDVSERTGRSTTETGSYCVTGSRVTVARFQVGECAPPALFDAAWELTGRELRFTDVVTADGRGTPLFDALWGGQVWIKVD